MYCGNVMMSGHTKVITSFFLCYYGNSMFFYMYRGIIWTFLCLLVRRLWGMWNGEKRKGVFGKKKQKLLHIHKTALKAYSDHLALRAVNGKMLFDNPLYSLYLKILYL